MRLSGPVSYMGGTQLRQGGLHIDGSGVFSMRSFVEAIQGTSLIYSAGTDMPRPLTLLQFDPSLDIPVAHYTAVTPPPGLEDAMAWRVESGTATHSGLLQGTLPFIKKGAGQLNISGDAMAYTGQATVLEGSLAINELFSGSVRVGTGTRLHGTGSVASVHLQGGSTLAPGNTLDVAASPAHEIGALRVTGDLHLEPGSRFEVDATPTGLADFVWVGGKALLDGEVSVLAQAGTWNEETAFPILSARDGFEGTQFDAVSSDLAFLIPGLQYSADTVTLTLKRNDISIGDVGDTPDETDVGEIIDEGGGMPDATPDEPDVAEVVDEGGDAAGNTPDDTDVAEVVDEGGDVAGDTPDETDVAEVIDEGSGTADDTPPLVAEVPKEPDLRDSMLALNREQARGALAQLTGSWHASVLSSVWDSSRFVREAVLHQSNEMLDRRAAGFGRGMARPQHVGYPSSARLDPDADTAAGYERRLQTWLELFHSEKTRDSQSGILGDTRRIQGFVLGLAAELRPAWQLGAFIGAQQSSLSRENSAADARIYSTHMGLHFATHYLGWRLMVGAARSLHRFSTQREVLLGQWRDALSARYRGRTTQVFGEASLPMDLSVGQRPVTAAPFVQMAWVQTQLDGFTESGGPAALQVQPAAMKGWVSTLGVRAEAAVGASGADQGRYGLAQGKVFAQLAWHHSRHDDPRSVQSFRNSASQRLFSSQGISPLRQAWSLRLGLDAPLTKTAHVGFTYLGAYGKGQRDHGIGGWARIAF